MTLEPQDKRSLSDMRMAKALEFLEDARANAREKRSRTAVNRSYYAADMIGMIESARKKLST
jgi:uncharacterized protein (UPF0332 family)